MEYISYCSLLCNEYLVYIATRNNDDEMKAKLALGYLNVMCNVNVGVGLPSLLFEDPAILSEICLLF